MSLHVHLTITSSNKTAIILVIKLQYKYNTEILQAKYDRMEIDLKIRCNKNNFIVKTTNRKIYLVSLVDVNYVYVLVGVSSGATSGICVRFYARLSLLCHKMELLRHVMIS